MTSLEVLGATRRLDVRLRADGDRLRTPDQAAVVSVRAAPMLEKEAKKRMAASGRTGGKKAGRGRPNRGGDHSSPPLSTRSAENQRTAARRRR